MLSHFSDRTFKILVRQPIPSKTAHQDFSFRILPHCVADAPAAFQCSASRWLELAPLWPCRPYMPGSPHSVIFPTFKDFFLLENIKPSITPHALHLNPINARLHVIPSRSQQTHLIRQYAFQGWYVLFFWLVESWQNSSRHWERDAIESSVELRSH